MGWATDQTYVLGSKGCEAKFMGKVGLLDNFNSVTQAIDALNTGGVLCESGFCAVWSASKNAYYLLWEANMVKVALGLFGLAPALIPGMDPVPVDSLVRSTSSRTATTASETRNCRDMTHRVAPALRAPKTTTSSEVSRTRRARARSAPALPEANRTTTI
mmetsp:Transcript_150759/g.281199  ORF Transcript_150759/g.281199 Transcript_150759/m.281199 type:complete len:160 (-) Transcript_150759:22-501(-)